jgi:carbamoyltransferase
MNILGLTTMGASAACVMIDGKLIAAVEEERLTRIKNDGGFPIESIKEVLDIAGLGINDIDVIAVYWKPYVLWPRIKGVIRKIIRNPKTIFNYTSSIKQMLFNQFGEQERREEDRGSWSHLFYIKEKIKKEIGINSAQIKFFDHHLTHQVYGEQMRDWNKYISLSYDGGGEAVSTRISFVNNKKREDIYNINWPNSLGHYYSFFTGYLGFKMLEGEYKMMGLAPYGNPKYVQAIKTHFVKINNNRKNIYAINTKLCDYHSALNGKFHSDVEKLLCKKRMNDEKPSQNHLDLAHSVQIVFEEMLLNLVQSAMNEIKIDVDKIVITGGCALNVTANGKLLSSNLIQDVIIPPAPHDAGCSIGAAILANGSENLDIQSFRNPYLGRQYKSKNIEELLKESGLNYKRVEDENKYCEEIAHFIAENKIVAWFQGGSEFGPRALGNRSYLANPRTDEIRDIINEKIKKRELFRPFAPSVLFEYSKDYFELRQDSPYMNIVANVKKDKVKEIPAVTHVDGTARVHTVRADVNPKYHKLISSFYNKTGTPVLLNTSLNIQEPIVYSPANAINTFVNSGVDVLAIEDFIVVR